MPDLDLSAPPLVPARFLGSPYQDKHRAADPDLPFYRDDDSPPRVLLPFMDFWRGRHLVLNTARLDAPAALERLRWRLLSSIAKHKQDDIDAACAEIHAAGGGEHWGVLYGSGPPETERYLIHAGQNEDGHWWHNSRSWPAAEDAKSLVDRLAQLPRPDQTTAGDRLARAEWKWARREAWAGLVDWLLLVAVDRRLQCEGVSQWSGRSLVTMNGRVYSFHGTADGRTATEAWPQPDDHVIEVSDA